MPGICFVLQRALGSQLMTGAVVVQLGVQVNMSATQRFIENRPLLAVSLPPNRQPSLEYFS